MDQDPSFEVSSISKEMDADPTYGDPIGFEEAQSITAGQPEVHEPVESEESIIDEGKKVLKAGVDITNALLNPLDPRSRNRDTITRMAVGASEIATDPYLVGANLIDKLGGIDPNDPESLNIAVQSQIAALERIRDKAQKRMGDEGTDYIAGGTKFGISIAALAKMKVAQALWGKVLQGAGTGYYFGLTDYKPKEGEAYKFSEAHKQARDTAIAGAVIPVAGQALAKTGQGIKHVAQGTKEIFAKSPAKLYKQAIPEGELKGNIAALRDKSLESKVPGVKLTVGQKIAKAEKLKSPQAPALEHIAKDVVPEQLGSTGRGGQQIAARAKAVGSIAKDQKTLQAAIEKRDAVTKPLYEKAHKMIVKLDKKFNDRIAKLPPMKQAMREAKEMAKTEEILRGKPISTSERLHFAKIKLDEMLTKTDKVGAPALSNTQRRQVAESKQFLTSWLRKRNPEYGKAMDQYAKLSKPIDRMKVGQRLEEKLVSPVADAKEHSLTFAREMKKLKTKEEFGKPLWSKLTKKQQNRMEAVLEDLHTNSRYMTQTNEALKSAAERTKSKGIGPIGAFQPLISAARSRIDAKMSAFTKRGYAQLAKLMKDPEKFADMLEDASPAHQKVIGEIMYKWISNPAIIGTAQAEDK